MSGALARRIMVRLERAELLEVNPHVQCDIRIAWLRVGNEGEAGFAVGEFHVQISPDYIRSGRLRCLLFV